MDYHLYITVKQFLTGLVVVGIIMMLISFFNHKNLILTVFLNSMKALLNAVMSILIMFGGIIYVIKSLFTNKG